MDAAELLALLEEDRAFVDELWRAGILEPRDGGYGLEDVEIARVAHTLVRELDVNWAGVEVILRMRAELLATRRQVAELLELLATRH